MKTFRELKIGQKFRLTPYDPWLSEKISDSRAKVDVSSTTYKLIDIRLDAQVIANT